MTKGNPRVPGVDIQRLESRLYILDYHIKYYFQYYRLIAIEFDCLVHVFSKL